MNLFKFEFPIDLASAIVGFLLAISLYVFDKLLEPNITIEVTDPSDLNLSQGLFKVLNVKISNKHYKEIWETIQKYNLCKTWRVNNIFIFIHLGDDGFRLFKKYKLLR